MYQYRRVFVSAEMEISEIIKENPSILLVLEHFGIDDILHYKSVEELCKKHNIETILFLAISNLYNGFKAVDALNLQVTSIPLVLDFLRNSHHYYLNEKYPEIKGYIKTLGNKGNAKEIKLVESFFDEYFNEVKEHLEYEEEIAFPYFSMISEINIKPAKKAFSSSTYLNHHSDIETKLEDLKNLLLQHLQIKNQANIKRKLLFSLFELEFDLKIHSLIEEQILIPLAVLAEKKIR